jgi:hypothetical protein
MAILDRGASQGLQWIAGSAEQLRRAFDEERYETLETFLRAERLYGTCASLFSGLARLNASRERWQS